MGAPIPGLDSGCASSFNDFASPRAAGSIFVFMFHVYIFSVNNSKTFVKRGDMEKKKEERIIEEELVNMGQKAEVAVAAV